ncbi:MAG: ATP-binding protein [Candidatus Nealsonbacteria bacterium]
MSLKFKVNKEKCISCGVCIAVCPEGADWNEDGKSKIIDSEEIEKCGGETVCPYEAIEKVKEEK